MEARLTDLEPEIPANPSDAKAPEFAGALTEGFLDVTAANGIGLSLSVTEFERLGAVSARVVADVTPREGALLSRGTTGTATLRDDDDPALLNDDLIDRHVEDARRLMPPRSFTEGPYVAAFIAFEYDGGGNRENDQIGPNRTDFKLFSRPTRSEAREVWQSRVHNSDPAYLVAALQLAFQATPEGDGDGEDAEFGLAIEGEANSGRSATGANTGLSFIFLEGARDEAVREGGSQLRFRKKLGKNAAHEIWHSLTMIGDAFTTQMGLMSANVDDPEVFFPRDLEDLRNVISFYRDQRAGFE